MHIPVFLCIGTIEYQNVNNDHSGRIRLDVTGLLKISHAHLRSSIAVTYRSAPSRMRIRESSLDTRLTVWRTLVENIRLVTFSWDKHVCLAWLLGLVGYLVVYPFSPSGRDLKYFLKLDIEGAWTTCSGSLFQELTTLLLKKNFLISVRLNCFDILREWPLVLLLLNLKELLDLFW